MDKESSEGPITILLRVTMQGEDVTCEAVHDWEIAQMTLGHAVLQMAKMFEKPSSEVISALEVEVGKLEDRLPDYRPRSKEEPYGV